MATRDQRARGEIEKIFRAAGIGYGVTTRTGQLKPQAKRAEPADNGAFDWILTTELPVTVFDWDRWEFVNEVLLADGMRVPATGQVPLLDSHNRGSVKDVLGHVRDFSEAVAGSYPARTGQVHFAEDADSQAAKMKVAGGHITDGSVGYVQTKSVWIMDGQQAAINGKLFDGPLRVTYEWELREFSLCPIGADVLAKVRLLCGN